VESKISGRILCHLCYHHLDFSRWLCKLLSKRIFSVLCEASQDVAVESRLSRYLQVVGALLLIDDELRPMRVTGILIHPFHLNSYQYALVRLMINSCHSCSCNSINAINT
jgi:hypothetical protein